MPRGPMGGRRAVEEPHDFGKVMGKLVNYCRNYLPVIIIALILGAAGTVCQIVTKQIRRWHGGTWASA